MIMDALEVLGMPLALLTSVQAMIAALGSGFTVKGVVEDASELPESGDLGDIYLMSSEGYTTYTWDGTQWVAKINDVATAQELQSALYS